MKLIIVGSHTFTDYQLLCQMLAPERHRITQVRTGGARGAAQLGFRWALKHHIGLNIEKLSYAATTKQFLPDVP